MITEIPLYANTSLYVGDLDDSVTEAMLFEKFSTCGSVSLVKVCRDKVTRQSLGYAYVNYLQPADALRALDSLNFEPLANKPMRLMWSQRDPALRKSGVGNVFIKNLDEMIDNKTLYDTFSGFGNIISCKIMYDEKTNKSKGYGFVHYETEEEAYKAINSANGKQIASKIVFVGKFLPKYNRLQENDEQTIKFKNVFVKNFQEELNDESLFNLFSKFGEITSAKVSQKSNGASAGFGFVNFVDPDSAIQAVNEMNGYNLNDRVLYVTRFENKIERLGKLKKIYEERKQEYLRKYQNSNLFIKNLDDQIDDARLSKEFSKFGAIKSVKVMLDEKKQSKGFGFVCFENNESAKAAFDEMNGRILLTKPLFVAIAQRKEERKKILAAKFKQRMQANQQIIPFSTNNNYYVNTLGQFQNYASISVPRWQNKANINQRNIYSGQQTADYLRVQPQQQYFVHSKTNNHNQIIQKQPYVGLAVAQQNQQVPYASNFSNQQSSRANNDRNTFINELSSVKPIMQKTMIGDQLYLSVSHLSNQNPGKITGMLLDGCDVSELLRMLDDEHLLITRIHEAENVLNSIQIQQIK